MDETKLCSNVSVYIEGQPQLAGFQERDSVCYTYRCLRLGVGWTRPNCVPMFQYIYVRHSWLGFKKKTVCYTYRCLRLGVGWTRPNCVPMFQYIYRRSDTAGWVSRKRLCVTLTGV